MPSPPPPVPDAAAVADRDAQKRDEGGGFPVWVAVLVVLLLLLVAGALFALRRRQAWARRRQYALRHFPLPPPGGSLARKSVPLGLERAPTMKGPREEAAERARQTRTQSGAVFNPLSAAGLEMQALAEAGEEESEASGTDSGGEGGGGGGGRGAMSPEQGAELMEEVEQEELMECALELVESASAQLDELSKRLEGETQGLLARELDSLRANIATMQESLHEDGGEAGEAKFENAEAKLDAVMDLASEAAGVMKGLEELLVRQRANREAISLRAVAALKVSSHRAVQDLNYAQQVLAGGSTGSEASGFSETKDSKVQYVVDNVVEVGGQITEAVAALADDLPEALSSEAEALRLAAVACTETMSGFNVQGASSSGTQALGLGVASLLSQAEALHSKIQELYPNIQEDAEAVAGMEDALSVIKRMRMHLRHVERPGRTEAEEGPEVSNELFRALAARRAGKAWKDKLDKRPTMMPLRPEQTDRRLTGI